MFENLVIKIWRFRVKSHFQKASKNVKKQGIKFEQIIQKSIQKKLRIHT